MTTIKPYIRLLVGLALYAVGIVLTILPALGLAPWDSLHQGLSLHFPMTFGIAGIIIGLIILVVIFFLNEPIGLGTICNIVLIGLMIDGLMQHDIFPIPEELWVRVLMFFLGIVIICIASWLYIGAGMGAGPRDGLMLTIMRYTHLPVSTSRIIIEGSVALCGFLLGGQIGFGTIAIFLLVGPILQIWFRLVDFNPIAVKHNTITFRGLRKGVSNGR